jgi:ABC-type branched-subunit amino acid transport system ATPase component
VIHVLKGVSLQVPEGGIVALLGANGAEKSTTLKAISGLLRTERGEVTKGSVEWLGKPIQRDDASEIVRQGIVQVIEGRQVFEHLTVEENLLTGAHTRRNGREVRRDLELLYEYFPRLAERRGVGAGYISGGEQQMLAIGRALMVRPKLMLLDESSMGLAPLLVADIFGIRRPAQPGGEGVDPPRRAERRHRTALCPPRLRDGERPHRPRRRRGDHQRQRREGVLFGPDRGGPAQELPRSEALQAPQTLAVVRNPMAHE